VIASLNSILGCTPTPAQQEAIDFHLALNVPASWFARSYPSHDHPGEMAIEVIALGDDFVWSFHIEPDGDASSAEATLGEFSTGITC
jgi:hypothetical protein